MTGGYPKAEYLDAAGADEFYLMYSWGWAGGISNKGVMWPDYWDPEAERPDDNLYDDLREPYISGMFSFDPDLVTPGWASAFCEYRGSTYWSGEGSQAVEFLTGNPRAFQRIIVEPNALVVGQGIQLRILGGFDREISNFDITITDANGQEWIADDILDSAGPIVDEETGEVLFSAAGEPLDEVQYAVIEEDPYWADVRRTMVVRLNIPESKEEGEQTIQFALGLCDIDLTYDDASGETYAFAFANVANTICVECVVPDANGHPEATDFLPVCDPFPTVELDPISESEVYFDETGNMRLSIRGRVWDPIASVIDGENADIESVMVQSNYSETLAEIPLTRDAGYNEGYNPIWKPFPYRSNPFECDISVVPRDGDNYITAVTSANAAGNRGDDSVRIDVAHISFGGNGSTGQDWTILVRLPIAWDHANEDTIYLAFEENAAPEDFVELLENAPNSYVFQSELQSVLVTISFEGEPVLTDGQDLFSMELSVQGTGNLISTFHLDLSEFASPDLFRGVVLGTSLDENGVRLIPTVLAVENFDAETMGYFSGFAIRIKGENIEGMGCALSGTEHEYETVEEADGVYYLHGSPGALFVCLHQPSVGHAMLVKESELESIEARIRSGRVPLRQLHAMSITPSSVTIPGTTASKAVPITLRLTNWQFDEDAHFDFDYGNLQRSGIPPVVENRTEGDQEVGYIEETYEIENILAPGTCGVVLHTFEGGQKDSSVPNIFRLTKHVASVGGSAQPLYELAGVAFHQSAALADELAEALKYMAVGEEGLRAIKKTTVRKLVVHEHSSVRIAGVAKIREVDPVTNAHRFVDVSFEVDVTRDDFFSITYAEDEYFLTRRTDIANSIADDWATKIESVALTVDLFFQVLGLAECYKKCTDPQTMLQLLKYYDEITMPSNTAILRASAMGQFVETFYDLAGIDVHPTLALVGSTWLSDMVHNSDRNALSRMNKVVKRYLREIRREMRRR